MSELLCALSDLPEIGAKGFDPAQSGSDTLFVVRRFDAVFAYRNVCPHEHTPLAWRKDRYLSTDGSQIVCFAHNARFNLADGECTEGPCFGQRLEALPVTVKDGVIHVGIPVGLIHP